MNPVLGSQMGTSGWEDVVFPRPCQHPDRPVADLSDHGRIWFCAYCRGRYFVQSLDHGHDVMPGEQRVTAHWIMIGRKS